MLVSLILARLLDPSAFGLIASVAIFITVAQHLINGGIAQRILQKPVIEDADYSALFWCNGLASLACVVGLAALSGPVATFFESPETRWILIALAGTLLIMNAGRVQATRLQRELRFRALSVINIGSVVVGCIVGVAMALRGFGVWSLIGQHAGSALVRAGSLWWLMPWRPRGAFPWAHARDLYAYGLPVMFSQIVRVVSGQWINVLIARQVSMDMLGFYDRGRVIPHNLGYSLANIFARTNFPVLAKLQNDPAGFRATYLRFIQVTAAIFFMLMTGLAVCAHDLVVIILGERWLPSVWFLQANCAAFSFFVVFNANAEVLRAKGMTNRFFRYNMLCAGLQLTGIFLGIPWGAKGMVLGDLIARGIACIPLVWAIGRMTAITPLDQLRCLLRPVAGALVLAGLLIMVQGQPWIVWIRFIVSGVVGLAVLFGYWWLNGRQACRGRVT
jgi:O-antigen/teichoic acid export membrane protein